MGEWRDTVALWQVTALQCQRFVYRGWIRRLGGYRFIGSCWLTRRNGRTAAFCFNDPVAVGAIKAILEAGLNVPHNIAVVGVGNVHYSDQLRVPLSTIDQSSSQVGQNAAELVLQLVEKRVRGTRTVELPPHLIGAPRVP